MLSLTQELQTMRDEKETLLMAGVQSSAEELQSTVASLTEERDQLKMDMQENVEMVSYHAATLTVQILKMQIFPSAVSTMMFVFISTCQIKVLFLPNR